MALKMYSVRDAAVAAFMPPFYCKSDGEAVRSFQDAVNDKATPFYKHPGDFILYSLGEFDEVTGLATCSGPNQIITASQLAADVAGTVY